MDEAGGPNYPEGVSRITGGSFGCLPAQAVWHLGGTYRISARRALQTLPNPRMQPTSAWARVSDGGQWNERLCGRGA